MDEVKDIVPELYKKIKSDFDKKINNNKTIQEILEEEETEASLEDVFFLSGEIGNYAYQSLSKHITKDNMPDGKLYWNILERTLIPIMEEVHKIVNNLAVQVQLSIDRKQNVGIKPLRTEFPRERVVAIINKIIEMQDEVINDG